MVTVVLSYAAQPWRTIMKTTSPAPLVVLLALHIGCPQADPVIVEDEAPQEPQAATCSGVPIPGAELVLIRTTGAPNTGSMVLPALTAVCLKVESNTASGSVVLDEESVFEPSDFKNKEIVLHHMAEGLALEPHSVTAKIASTPHEHYLKVTAYYPVKELANGSEITNIDEALFLGQAFITYHSHLSTFSRWAGATAVQAIALENFAGEVEAYEVSVQDSMGADAGYVVLERNELRPLLGSAWGQGPSLSQRLAQKHKSLYTEDFTQETFRYLWAGFGIMGLEVTLDDQTKQLVSTCGDDACPDFTFEGFDRPIADYVAAGLTTEEYIAQRREYVEDMLGSMLNNEGNGKVTPDDAKPLGFFAGSASAENSTSEAIASEANHFDVLPVCEAPKYPRERYVPGEYSKDELTLLSSLHQYKHEWNEKELCSTGCVPVAATILMNYWDRRYEFLIEGSGNTSVFDAGIELATEEIRGTIGTWCTEKNAGRTPGGNLAKHLGEYINDRATKPVGWTFAHLLIGDESPQVRQDHFWPEIEHGHPPILHYFVSSEKNPDPEDGTDTNHAVVAYGYIDDGRADWLSDWVVMAKGWKDQPVDVLPTDAAGGMRMTRVTPGCYIPSSPNDYCMDFHDITPELSWGRESVETLSCMCVVRGQPDGRFLPNDSITKAEFLKIVLKLAYPGEQTNLDGVEENPGLGVCPNHWASGYISFAKKKSMLGWPIVGNPAFFSADAPITRQEAAYLLAQAGLGEAGATFKQLFALSQCAKDSDDHPFKTPSDDPNSPDKEDIDPVFLPYILATTSECVFEGYKLNPEDDDPLTFREFKGTKTISRIEAAKVACVARFGSKSDKCSQGYACIPLVKVSCP